jgi:hypothetical protein
MTSCSAAVLSEVQSKANRCYWSFSLKEACKKLEKYVQGIQSYKDKKHVTNNNPGYVYLILFV